MKRCHPRDHQHNAVPPKGHFASLVVAALLLLPLCAWSQQSTEGTLLRWMDQIAQEQLRWRETTVAGIRNIGDSERRKNFVRETILSLLGGLPEYNGPLNPRITGTIRGEGYAIES